MRATVLLPLLGLCACAGGAPPAAGGDPFAGMEWEVAFVRPGTSLRGLCAVDAAVVWASGSRGTVLRSRDGARTWQQVGPADTADLDFRSVHAFDADRALVCTAGQPARIYRTTDGGASWTVVHEDPRPAAFFDAVAFHGDRGLVVGDPIDGALQVLASWDAGASWQPQHQHAGTAPAAGEAMFAASGTCLVADRSVPDERFWVVTGGSRSRSLRTETLGAHWHVAALPLRQGEPSQGAFSVAFFDRAHGVAVGGDYRAPEVAEGTAAISSDCGSSWTPVPGGALGYRSAVAALPDGRSCIAVGDGGTSVSRDRGASWQSFGGEGFHAVAAAPGLVVAVGGAGRVGRLVPAAVRP